MKMRTTGRHGSPGWTSMSIALLSVPLLVGCANEIHSNPAGKSTTESRPTVALAAAEAENHRSFQTQLYSEHDADLYNRLSIQGTARGGIPITAILVEVDDLVRARQLLATLEKSDARLYVEAAEPEAEIAATNLRRVEKLRKTGAVSEAEYDDAVFRSRTANAALEQAQLNLSRTQIRAPFAGVVAKRYVRVGDIVDDEMPLFRVTAMAPLRARLLVPESEVGLFGIDAPVLIAAADGTLGTARVIIIGPTIDPGSGTREVILELAEVGAFRPGASVVAELADEEPPEEPERAAP